MIGSLPFTGRWLVEPSPAQQAPSHGTHTFGVGYALDFIAVDDRNRASPTVSWRTLIATEPPEIFYAFGLHVLSPVSGTIASIHDGELDNAARRSWLTIMPYMLGQAAWVHRRVEAIAGNYVVIAPDDFDAYIAIVNLQYGSVLVSPGQRVSEGQHLGNCGNSGNSTQPHIHIQAMDGMDIYAARGVPLFFRQLSNGGRGWMIS